MTDLDAPGAPRVDVPRRWLVREVWLVFALSLGIDGLYSLLDIVRDLLRGPLTHQAASLNVSQAQGHPLLDLGFQLLGIASSLVPVALALFLLERSGERRHDIGFDTGSRRFDLSRGALLAAVVGGTGLAFYLGSYALGTSLAVQAEDLPHVWWQYPVLLLQAGRDGVLEEVLVVGFLLRRLKQLGWSDNRSLVASALLRGSYHLYQGFGGGVANAVMGLLFGKLYQRWGRVGPLVVAHALIDAVAFCGYAALAGKVSWIPLA